MEEEKLYPRRWAILIGMTCILIAIQFNNILPGGAAVATMQAYGIQPMMFSMIMSAPYLSGFLFAILAGVMADRIGLNKILMAGFIAGLVGAIIRVFSVGNFALIIVAMIILGFAVACLNANSAKLLRDWFPGKANAFAMGVYTAGMTFGAAFALWYGSAAVPPASDAALAADPAAAIESVGQSLQQAWIVGAVFIAVGIVIWVICYRKHPAVELNKEPVGQYMKEVLKNPAVWGISILPSWFSAVRRTLTARIWSLLFPPLQAVRSSRRKPVCCPLLIQFSVRYSRCYCRRCLLASLKRCADLSGFVLLLPQVASRSSTSSPTAR